MAALRSAADAGRMALAASGAISFALATACTFFSEPAPSAIPAAAATIADAQAAFVRSSHLRLCEAGEIDTLDPAYVTRGTARRIVMELFDGLTHLTSDGRVVPSLAERWEASDDRRTWTFYLRDDARWSDGRPVVADDVVYSFARLLHPGMLSPHADTLSSIEGAKDYVLSFGEDIFRDLADLDLPPSVGVRARDARTVVVAFERSAPLAPALLARPALRVVPRHLVVAEPHAWPEPARIVTGGPFHLAAAGPDDHELVRSPTFWGRRDVALERVTVLASRTVSDALALYGAGACDATAPSVELEPGGAFDPAEVVPSLQLGTYYLLLDTDRLDRDLRRALAHAIDREALPLAPMFQHVRSSSLTPGYAAHELPAAARRGCEAAGEIATVALPIGIDDACYLPPRGLELSPVEAGRARERVRERLGDEYPPPLTILVNDVPAEHAAIARAVARRWELALGIRASVEVVTWADLVRRTAAGDYQVARLGWMSPAPDPGYHLAPFSCDSPDNRTGWCDPRFDELLAAADAEPDLARRLALLREAETIVLAAAPVIPLYVYRVTILRKPHVHRLVPSGGHGTFSLREVSLGADRDGRDPDEPPPPVPATTAPAARPPATPAPPRRPP